MYFFVCVCFSEREKDDDEEVEELTALTRYITTENLVFFCLFASNKEKIRKISASSLSLCFPVVLSYNSSYFCSLTLLTLCVWWFQLILALFLSISGNEKKKKKEAND